MLRSSLRRVKRLARGRPAFAVIGTGRCGTGSVAQYLRSAGVECGHEQFFTPRGPVFNPYRSPSAAGDASWLAVPYVSRMDMPLVHLVRDPLAVIASFYKIGFFHAEPPGDQGATVAFAKRHFRFSADPLRSSTRWWIEWNRRCEALTDQRLRLEDAGHRRTELLAWLGVDGDPNVPFPHANERAVAYEVPRALREKIVEMPEYLDLARLAARYGYTV